jgi:hypothetical protein
MAKTYYKVVGTGSNKEDFSAAHVNANSISVMVKK